MQKEIAYKDCCFLFIKNDAFIFVKDVNMNMFFYIYLGMVVQFLEGMSLKFVFLV